MKRTTLTNGSIAVWLTALAALTMALSACTKSRDKIVADESVDAQLIPVSELTAEGYQVKLSNDTGAQDFQGKALAVNEKPSFKTASVSAPNKLHKALDSNPLFAVRGKSGSTVAMRFELNAKLGNKLLFIDLRVDDPSTLSTLDQAKVVTIQGIQYMRAYTLPIIKAGTLVSERTDTGERSYKQDLWETPIDQATYVQVDNRPEMLKPVDIPTDDAGQVTRSELQLANNLNNQLTTAGALGGLLQTNFDNLKADDKVFTTLAKSSSRATSVDKPTDPNTVYLRIFKIVQLSEVKAKLAGMKDENSVRLLAALNDMSSGKYDQIRTCSDDAKASLGKGDDCVMLLRDEVPATAQKAVFKLGDNGFPTGDLSLQPMAATGGNDLLLVTKAVIPTQVKTTDYGDLKFLSPLTTIRIADIKDKEFLLRRTLEDSASTIDVFGPGESGETALVKITIENNRLVVRRVNSLVHNNTKAGQIDKEELMSFWVDLYTTHGPNGELLNSPEKVGLDKAEYAAVNWTDNMLQTTLSPMGAFDEAGQCLGGGSYKAVSDMDMRLATDGVMNFSIDGSYSFTPDCWTYLNLHDYGTGGGTLQQNFNLKERISFKAYDQSHDQRVVRDLPFQAQNLLNFGVFTLGQPIVDHYGNGASGNKINNLAAYPVIQDFTDGKVLTYNLGGLPDESETTPDGTPLRPVFINTTRKVVADWNEALHRAFKGTSLDRSGDYIALKIDGIDAAPGHLGDLDRNYIWNFDKAMSSSILGISQPAANPNDGLQEANNVLMYSGNVMTYIGYEKAAAKLLKQYNESKAAVTAQFQQDLANEQAQAAAAAQAQQQPTQQPQGAIDASGAATSGSTTDSAGGSSQMKTGFAMDLISQINKAASVSQVRSAAMPKVLSGYALANAVKLQGVLNQDVNGRSAELLGDMHNPDAMYVHNLVQSLLKNKAVNDPAMVNALDAAEMLNTYGNQLSNDERSALTTQVQLAALRNRFAKGLMANRAGCMMSLEGIPVLGSDSLLNMSDADLFANWYGMTLVHEMGHSLGLTHNFKGSMDGANFLFPEEADAKALQDGRLATQGKQSDAYQWRAYSSVMDYFLPTEPNENYHKPGPYDIHALRAIYTGMLELDLNTFAPKLGAKPSDLQGKTFKVTMPDAQGSKAQLTITNGEVNIDDLKNVLVKPMIGSDGKPVMSWWKLDGDSLKNTPLVFKQYMYCNDADTDAFQDPSCNRFDSGTSQKEIVKSWERYLHDTYVLHSGVSNNILMYRAPVGMIASQYIKMSAFFDEIFYKASILHTKDYTGDIDGAFEAYRYFINTVNAPEINKDVMDPGHFVRFDYKVDSGEKDANGNPIQKVVTTAIDGRPVRSQGRPGVSNLSISWYGSEYERALAFDMLTNRSLGYYRYGQWGLSLCFADFEKYLLGWDTKQSLIMNSLQAALDDSSFGLMFMDDGYGIVDPRYAADLNSSPLLRFYTAFSATVSLDIDTSSDSGKGNYANLFHVGSTLNGASPADRLSVASDGSQGSGGALKYWALNNADVATALISDVAMKQIFLTRFDDLVAAYVNIAKNNADDAARTTALAGLTKLLTDMNSNGMLRSADDIQKGNTIDKLALALYTDFMNQTRKVFSTYQALTTQNQPDTGKPLSDADINQIMQDQDAQFNYAPPMKRAALDASRQNPFASVAGEAAMAVVKAQYPNGAAPGLEALASHMMADKQDLQSHMSTLLDNVQTLQTLTIAVHPELNR